MNKNMESSGIRLSVNGVALFGIELVARNPDLANPESHSAE
jgi:hypothetical protein